MRKILVAVLLLGTQAAARSEEAPNASGGYLDLTLRDMHGHAFKYSQVKGKLNVVMFFSTRCPISNAFNFRRNTLYQTFRQQVTFIAVDSNVNETLEEVRMYAREVGFDFPVYKDESNVMADHFGALVTTECFVLDSSGVVRYRGHIEDSPHAERSRLHGLRVALEAILAGKPVEIPLTKALGCSIRRNHVPHNGVATAGRGAL